MNQILNQYHLTFKNVILNDGTILKTCEAPAATDSSTIALHLTSSRKFDMFDSILYDVERALANEGYQKEHSIGDTFVQIALTTVTIDEWITLPITDYKAILEEWI